MRASNGNGQRRGLIGASGSDHPVLTGAIRRNLGRLYRFPTLRVALIHATSGLAWVVANLLFARALPAASYGELALVIAIVSLAMPLAPAGADGVVNRRLLPPNRELLTRVLVTSVVVASAACILGAWLYQLDTLYVLLIGIAVLFGGVVFLVAAEFQCHQRFGSALLIRESRSGVLLLAGLGLLIGLLDRPVTVIVWLVLGLVVAAIAGWTWLVHHAGIVGSRDQRFDWREALSYAGVTGAILILLQLERLVIPVVFSLEDIAVFGVLASIVGAPFRMMQQALGFTLLPRLRAATRTDQRKRILLREAVVTGAILLAGGTVIWFATPYVVRITLDGKYHLSDALIIAGLVSGTLKVLDAFARSGVAALGTVSQLSKFNHWGLVAVTAATAAAIFGSRWGLAGVIYGVGVGWGARFVIGAWITAPHLR